MVLNKSRQNQKKDLDIKVLKQVKRVLTLLNFHQRSVNKKSNMFPKEKKEHMVMVMEKMHHIKVERL